MRKFLNKLTCIALSLTFLMGCMATPAFAYSGEESNKTTTPSIFETEEEPVTITEQNTGPLTPEGNLTVVDDYQTTFSDGTAQQFITLVSKSGAYFYLIIDRAADGDQTAHFLNMVDEADLLALMDEEDIPEPEPEPAPTPEPEPLPEPEPEEGEDGAGKFVLVLLVLAGIAGGGAYFWLKMREKQREAEENKPDPDADYREDEEEIVLPEEEPEAEPDEDAERRAYQGSNGYEEE